MLLVISVCGRGARGGVSVIDTLIFEKLDRNQHIHFIPLHEEPNISCVAALISSYQAQQHAVISDLSGCCPAIHKMFPWMETVSSPLQ